MHKAEKSSGQTLVEIIIIVAVLILIVTGIVVGLLTSVKGTTFSEHKAVATKYAQEGIELVRRERDKSWGSFYAKRNETYCVGEDEQLKKEAPCSVNLQSFYIRSVNITWDGVNSRMVVVSTVSWQEGTNMHDTELRTYLTEWK